MKSKIIAASVIVFALLASGGVVYFLHGPVSPSYTYKIEDNFVYGVGVGKYPKQAISDTQAELMAEQAAMDNARLQIVKAVYERNVKTDFVTVHSYGNGSISGTVKMTEIVRKEVKNNKIVVELRVPITEIN